MNDGERKRYTVKERVRRCVVNAAAVVYSEAALPERFHCPPPPYFFLYKLHGRDLTCEEHRTTLFSEIT